jgi:diguanylate cyclase (GGDEF)-like protein/PAS domain S-box-containing protein
MPPILARAGVFHYTLRRPRTERRIDLLVILNVIDVKTLYLVYAVFNLYLYLVYAVFNLYCLVFVFFLWLQNHRRYIGLSLIFCDFFLQFVGVVCLNLRGVIPDLISIVFANMCLIGGNVVLLFGLQLFFRQECRYAVNLAIFTLFSIIHVYFTFEVPSITVRNSNFAGAAILIFAQIILLVISDTKTPLWRAKRTLMPVAITACLIMSFNLATTLLAIRGNTIFSHSAANMVLAIAYSLISIGLCFSLSMAINRVLQIQLEEKILEHEKNERALLSSETKFARIFQNSPYALIISRLSDGKIFDVNDCFCELFGYSKEEAVRTNTINMRLWENPRDREYVVASLEKGLPVRDHEYRFRTKSGEIVIVLFSTQSIELPEGSLIISSILDISGRKGIEEDLQKNRRFLSSVIEYNAASIYVKNAEGVYMLVNRRWEEAFHLDRAACIGKTDTDLFPPREALQYRQYDREVIEKGEMAEREEVFRDMYGTHTFLSIKFPLRNESGTVQGICGIMTDITQRKRDEEKIRHLANHDPLTDLPTLRLARDRLAIVLSIAQRHGYLASVLFIDLDGFKKVNDTWGHDAGDQVLKTVASRLLSCVRNSDTVARLGGDEFLIILNEIQSPEDALKIARKVIEKVDLPIAVSAKSEREGDALEAGVSASVGIAIYPRDGVEIDDLIKKADEAMYAIKNNGKHGCAFAISSGGIDEAASDI